MTERTPLIFSPGLDGDYIIPEQPGRTYGPVLQVFQAAGFQPHFFAPEWPERDPQKWGQGMADYAETIARENNSGEVAMAGFSCGALVAVLGTHALEQRQNVEVAGLVACSISPWFGEARVRRSLLHPRSNLHQASETFQTNLRKLTLPKLTSPVQVYVGSEEMETVKAMYAETLAAWPQAEGITPPCRHDIFHEAYLRALSQNVGKLATKAV
ncbi:MAG TPA: hypothetical protein VLF60_04940 [Candidatus Saccharimonadales bacterium]|nr:hypothetical protein [Candidatus Saccharimonadales bacterium]